MAQIFLLASSSLGAAGSSAASPVPALSWEGVSEPKTTGLGLSGFFPTIAMRQPAPASQGSRRCPSCPLREGGPTRQRDLGWTPGKPAAQQERFPFPRKATRSQLHTGDGATCILAAELGNCPLSGAAPRLHRRPPADLRRAFSPRRCSPLGKSLLEHNQAYLSTCSISRSRGGRRRRATVLHVPVPSIKPGIVPKTDVLAPSHPLQPFTRLPELL